MKANKVTLIIQAIGMYMMHLPLYVYFILEMLPGSDTLPESLTKGLLIAALVMMALLLPLSIVNVILAAISIGKGEIDPAKTVMKVKLALIPWYVLNFVMCIILIAVLLNPFMMFAIPVMTGLLMGSAYIYMVTTSLPDVAYCLRRILVKKEETPTAARVCTVIFLFVFCLDVVAAILFYRQNKIAPLSPFGEPDLPDGE